MTRSYHRRWHRGHGKFYAISRSDAFEQTEIGRLFDVPAHLYRQAAIDVAAWFQHLMRGQTAQAFACESRLWFFLGFVRERRRQRRPAERQSKTKQIAAFVTLQARRWFARSAK